MIVLDTHALLWWVSGDSALSSAAQQCIKHELDTQGTILISSISAWEIAMLSATGRLTLMMDIDEWLNTVAQIEGVKFAPVDNGIAVQSVRLPGSFHKDPADRLIVALARHHTAPIVTKDEKIRNYRHVKTVW